MSAIFHFWLSHIQSLAKIIKILGPAGSRFSWLSPPQPLEEWAKEDLIFGVCIRFQAAKPRISTDSVVCLEVLMVGGGTFSVGKLVVRTNKPAFFVPASKPIW